MTHTSTRDIPSISDSKKEGTKVVFREKRNETKVRRKKERKETTRETPNGACFKYTICGPCGLGLNVHKSVHTAGDCGCVYVVMFQATKVIELQPPSVQDEDCHGNTLTRHSKWVAMRNWSRSLTSI